MGCEQLALPGAFYFTWLKKEVTRPSNRATENLFCFGTARKDILTHLGGGPALSFPGGDPAEERSPESHGREEQPKPLQVEATGKQKP